MIAQILKEDACVKQTTIHGKKQQRMAVKLLRKCLKVSTGEGFMQKRQTVILGLLILGFFDVRDRHLCLICGVVGRPKMSRGNLEVPEGLQVKNTCKGGKVSTGEGFMQKRQTVILGLLILGFFDVRDRHLCLICGVVGRPKMSRENLEVPEGLQVKNTCKGGNA